MKDLEKDQLLFSIIRNGDCMGFVESINGKIVTSGYIGENEYDSIVELIKGLQGFDIHIDNFYW